MKKSIRSLSLITLAIVIAIGINIAFAAWSGPLQNPPEGNVPAPINTSSNTQTLQGSKTINGSNINDILTLGLGVGFNSILGVNGIAQFFSFPISAIFDGNVGIGVTNPQAKLDVAGKIKVGDDAQTPTAGAIRFTGTDFEGYNGTEWKSLTASSVTTQAGLPFYGTAHTKEECQAAGGTVTDFQANSSCKFQASSCPSGWTRYQNLGSTSTDSCSSSCSFYGTPEGGGASCESYCPPTSCVTGNHNFANIPQETCGYTDREYYAYGGSCNSFPRTCYATLIEVGCY